MTKVVMWVGWNHPVLKRGDIGVLIELMPKIKSFGIVQVLPYYIVSWGSFIDSQFYEDIEVIGEL